MQSHEVEEREFLILVFVLLILRIKKAAHVLLAETELQRQERSELMEQVLEGDRKF